jgi:hypothetical protein
MTTIEEYRTKLKELEDRVSFLLKESNSKFDAATFLNFDALNVKTININNFEIKILASENYSNKRELVEIKTRQGFVMKAHKSKNTRHNIFFMSSEKVKKLTKEKIEELEEKISNAFELVFLFKRYKALRKEIDSEFDLRFSKQETYLYLRLVASEHFDEKARSRDDYRDYLDFSDFIQELKEKDDEITTKRNNELSER